MLKSLWWWVGGGWWVGVKTWILVLTFKPKINKSLSSAHEDRPVGTRGQDKLNGSNTGAAKGIS